MVSGAERSDTRADGHDFAGRLQTRDGLGRSRRDEFVVAGTAR